MIAHAIQNQKNHHFKEVKGNHSMKPKVLIENEVYRKIMHWVNKSEVEVSGLGTVVVDPGGQLRVISAMLLPQKNGPTHTDIEAESVCKAMYELREAPGELKFWWHSHVNMAVFWSGTDMGTIRSFGAGGWILSTVFNKKRELRSSYFSPDGIVTPWGSSELFCDELETFIGTIPDGKEIQWDEEYNKNIQTPVVPTYLDYRQRWDWQDEELPLPNRAKKRAKKGNRPDAEVSPMLDMKADDGLDAYGFNQEERTLLAGEGATDRDIEGLLEEDMTPTEIISCLQVGMTLDNIRWMLAKNYEPEEIEEIWIDMVQGQDAVQQ